MRKGKSPAPGGFMPPGVFCIGDFSMNLPQLPGGHASGFL